MNMRWTDEHLHAWIASAQQPGRRQCQWDKRFSARCLPASEGHSLPDVFDAQLLPHIDVGPFLHDLVRRIYHPYDSYSRFRHDNVIVLLRGPSAVKATHDVSISINPSLDPQTYGRLHAKVVQQVRIAGSRFARHLQIRDHLRVEGYVPHPRRSFVITAEPRTYVEVPFFTSKVPLAKTHIYMTCTDLAFDRGGGRPAALDLTRIRANYRAPGRSENVSGTVMDIAVYGRDDDEQVHLWAKMDVLHTHDGFVYWMDPETARAEIRYALEHYDLSEAQRTQLTARAN